MRVTAACNILENRSSKLLQTHTAHCEKMCGHNVIYYACCKNPFKTEKAELSKAVYELSEMFTVCVKHYSTDAGADVFRRIQTDPWLHFA